jgi:hypothetical protein
MSTDQPLHLSKQFIWPETHPNYQNSYRTDVCTVVHCTKRAHYRLQHSFQHAGVQGSRVLGDQQACFVAQDSGEGPYKYHCNEVQDIAIKGHCFQWPNKAAACKELFRVKAS